MPGWSLSPFARRIFLAAAIATAFVVLLLAFRQAGRVLLMGFGSILLAVFLNGIARVLGRRTPLPYTAAVALVAFGLVLFLAGAGLLAWPSLSGEMDQLSTRIPETLTSLRERLSSSDLGQQVLDRIESGSSGSGGGGLFGNLATQFGSVLGGLANVFFFLVVGLYLALDPGLYRGGLGHLLPLRYRSSLTELLAAEGHALRWWLVGRISSMAIVGVLIYVGLLLIGMPLAFLLAFLAALLSFIPNLGPILAAVPALLVALMEGPQMVLYVLLLYVAAETLESYFITPLIQLRVVSLPPALLLVFQIFMGTLFGVLGIFLAGPLLVVAMVFVQLVYVRGYLGGQVTVLGE